MKPLNRKVVSFASRFSSLAAFVFLAVAGCNGEPLATQQGYFLGSINIPAYGGWVGDTVRVTADAETGFFVFVGTAIDLKVRWTSSDPTVFTVIADGSETTQFAKLKMVGAGTATLTVNVDDTRIDPKSNVSSASSTVTVTQKGVMRVSPKTATIAIGATKDFNIGFVTTSGGSAANPRFAFDFTVSNGNVTSLVKTGTLTVADPPVATLKGLAAGTIKLIVRAYDQTDKLRQGKVYFEDTAVVTVSPTVATVVVDPNPKTLQVGFDHVFTATLKDNSGATLPSTTTTVTWSVLDQALATVDQTGRVTALAVGSTKVKVTTAEGVSGTADIVIEAAPFNPNVVRVVVTPDSVALRLSDVKCQFSAKAYDANGNEVQVAGFRWIIDDSTVGSVDASGLVTFKKVGFTAVRAFYGNDANAPGGSGSLTVNPNTP